MGFFNFKEIIDNQNRGKLDEGRNYQMGFAFVKKISKDRFVTVQPISPCKDYLNDVVFAEHTGKPCYAHGLEATKQDIFKNRTAFMVISICKITGSWGSYTDYAKDRKHLEENYPMLQVFMNEIEQRMGLKYKTEILPTDKEGVYLVKFDKYWTKSSYAISMYSLLLRIGQWFKKDNESLGYIKDFNAFEADVYLAKTAFPAMKKIIEKPKILVQDWSKEKGGYDIHNKGILSYKI